MKNTRRTVLNREHSIEVPVKGSTDELETIHVNENFVSVSWNDIPLALYYYKKSISGTEEFDKSLH